MSRVKDFFNKVMNKIGIGQKPRKPDTDIVEPAPGSNVGGRRRLERRRKSCRERHWGMARKDGRWMSPFDLYLLKREMDKSQSAERETPLSFPMVFGRQGMQCAFRYAAPRRPVM